jgi:hypothetical protein
VGILFRVYSVEKSLYLTTGHVGSTGLAGGVSAGLGQGLMAGSMAGKSRLVFLTLGERRKEGRKEGRGKMRTGKGDKGKQEERSRFEGGGMARDILMIGGWEGDNYGAGVKSSKGGNKRS